ncbi:hypothetical protein [Acidisoma sp. S159]|uniref:hypothetical protein n=1 Tax=Acidisoma sp. S159 TaxID=1747225 RepID=UPI00131D19B1|nr:hypothetical protein [Acidisoma sp. S159]
MAARLAQASVSFHFNDDDKYDDTHVTLTVRDVNGLVCAQVDSDYGHLNVVQKDEGPFGLVILNRQTSDLLQNGNFTIRITPNGHDTWRFNFDLVLALSDGSTLSGRVQGLELSRNNQQQEFELQRLLSVERHGQEISVADGPAGYFQEGDLQSGWRRCLKCQGMYFAGSGNGGICAVGGEHASDGSGDYLFDGGASGQHDWRWCNKCQLLHFGGVQPSVCAAGGLHSSTGSADYVLINNDPGALGQSGWNWCQKCQVLHFAGEESLGACASGGTHSSDGSGNYTLLD